VSGMVAKAVKDATQTIKRIVTIGTKYSGQRKMTKINHKNLSPQELKNSKRIFKSATPKYTVDWYIKWVASVFVLGAMSIRGVDGMQFYDLSLSLVGICLWLVVSILWKDRALIMLNGAGLIFLTRNLVEYVSTL
jgi:hypothetical protein